MGWFDYDSHYNRLGFLWDQVHFYEKWPSRNVGNIFFYRYVYMKHTRNETRAVLGRICTAVAFISTDDFHVINEDSFVTMQRGAVDLLWQMWGTEADIFRSGAEFVVWDRKKRSNPDFFTPSLAWGHGVYTMIHKSRCLTGWSFERMRSTCGTTDEDFNSAGDPITQVFDTSLVKIPGSLVSKIDLSFWIRGYLTEREGLYHRLLYREDIYA